MKVDATKLPGVVIIEPQVFGDERGFFLESYHEKRYREDAGITETFVQDNRSHSGKDVLRGIHFQQTKPQGKLVQVTQGEVFDVAVDINPESETFTQWVGASLSGSNHVQFYIPPGYGHAFLVVSDTADFQYKCTEFYYPDDEISVLWNDPDIDIDWPTTSPKLSEKDSSAMTLDEFLKL